MKNTKTNGAKRRSLLAIAFIVVIGLSFVACSEDGGGSGGTQPNQPPGGNNPSGGTFNSIYEFEMWLTAQPDNTAATAYTVKLNVSSLEGNTTIPGSVGYIISANRNKYLSLDLSGSSITSIGGMYDSGYFIYCGNLIGITIPDSVTAIWDAAFGYTGLTSVTIPNGVTTIGAAAFFGCVNLTRITIPNSVTTFGYGAFGSCYSLTSITIPNNVTSIKDDLFEKCTSLPSINIPDGVTSIGSGAFSGCTSLASVTIPAAVTSIGSKAFSDCTSLTSVKFLGTISSNGFDENAFYGSGNLRDKYFDTNGGTGTYGRAKGGSAWTKL